jgi:UDPglucose 6-dehydrogenase
MTAVSVFGLGKVGHTLAACLGTAGHAVVGYDPVAEKVDAINTRTYVSTEAGVTERLAQLNQSQLRATTSPHEAVLDSDVTMVIVPTPSNTLGGFSLRYVHEACEQIGKALRHKKEPHTLSIVSTVLPGASNGFLIPTVEAAAGRKVGDGLGYCYNPAFIALGEVVAGFEMPDYILIGESDAAAGDRIAAIHQTMVRNAAPVARMTPVEAEIAKIASNTHETMRVSFANMLFSLCSEVPGANVDRITGALAHRMGKRFFKGAVPYGGPCWPRDNRALAVFMDVVGVPSVLPRTIDIVNAEHGQFLLRKVLSSVGAGETVGLLGLSYKPNTPVIERSFGIDLAGWLAAENRNVVSWDPLAMDEARRVLGDRIGYLKSAEACLRASKAAIVINPMKEFASVDWSAGKETRVLDPWRCLSAAAIAQVGEYVPLGQGTGVPDASWLSGNLRDRLHHLNN